MEDKNLLDQKAKDTSAATIEQTTDATTSEEFDFDKYEQNLDEPTVDPQIERYQNLITRQDQLITDLRKQVEVLKQANFDIAQNANTAPPETTEDILANVFLGGNK